MSKPNVHKLVILGFKPGGKKTGDGQFIAPINPSTYQLKGGPGRGNMALTRKSLLEVNQFLSFELLFDATDAVQGNILNDVPVPEQIERLLTVLEIGASKNPNAGFLKVVWGSLDYKCRLEDQLTEFLLFNSHGLPIRAKMHLVFEKDK